MKSITYDAGKFYYDRNEIVNPEVLTGIRIESNRWQILHDNFGWIWLEDHDQIPFPATLRAEVEYQTKAFSPDWSKTTEWAYGSYKNDNFPVRKVVRLVEVESKPRKRTLSDLTEAAFEAQNKPSQGIPITEDMIRTAFPLHEPAPEAPEMQGTFMKMVEHEADKQAIDESYGFGLPMERHIDTIRDLPTVEAIEYLDKLLSKAFTAGRSKQSWESFQTEIGESSQPPPQAESLNPLSLEKYLSLIGADKTHAAAMIIWDTLEAHNLIITRNTKP
jgi:hypothetical protein